MFAGPQVLPTQVVPLPPPYPTTFHTSSDMFVPVAPIGYPLHFGFPAPIPPAPVVPTVSKEDQERLDYEFARKLVLDDIEMTKKTTTKASAQTITDSSLARKLDAEERGFVFVSPTEQKEKRQLEQDLALARKLDAEERQFQTETEKEKRKKPVVPTSFNVHQRNHIVNVHNRHCNCGNSQAYNNNHLVKLHDQHCHCAFSTTFNGNNAGKKHVHDYRCCNINHLHSEACHCHYRTHKHCHSCCPLSHTHNELCHCSDK